MSELGSIWEAWLVVDSFNEDDCELVTDCGSEVAARAESSVWMLVAAPSIISTACWRKAASWFRCYSRPVLSCPTFSAIFMSSANTIEDLSCTFSSPVRYVQFSFWDSFLGK